MPVIALSHIGESTLQIPGADPWHAKADDPAVSVMTDFRERASVTVAEAATIDAALEHMKHTGVRCAFATDEGRHVVVGLITAYDITSEKPVRHSTAVGGTHQDVLVRDIMEPIAEWRVADIRDIERATVGSLARLFEETRLTHVPVIEQAEQGGRRLRGLLSAAKVRRLLAK